MKEFVSNYSAYNLWANQQVVSFLSDLKNELLNKEVKSSFISINATLQHILISQKFWNAFITNENVQNFNWENLLKDTDVLMKELVNQSNLMLNNFSAFKNEELSEKLELNMPWCKNNLVRSEYIIHCINHSTYHRGQIITIAREVGVEGSIPNTDYNIFNSSK